MTSPQPPAPSSRPFAAAPDATRYFPAAGAEEARLRVVRSIQRAEGPVLVIGAAGLGKTLLLDVISRQFRDQLQAVTLAGGQLCTRRALLQMILFQLDLPYRDMDESELRLSLMAYLQSQPAGGKGILLLVDEADALPTRLLEELRALTNLSAAGRPLVNLILAGNSKLEEQFADPKLDLFSQRIAARCYLSAFGREETFQFVYAQVATADYEPKTLFTPDALEALFAATDGVPRLVNQLGDQLLWMVTETGISPLDGMIVQQAWSEIQQLPAPWNIQDAEPQASEVEFGELQIDDTVLDPTELDAETFNGVEVSEEIIVEDYPSAGSYAYECDDDLPASIPIHPAAVLIDEPAAASDPGSATLDVTEQLIDQLNEMTHRPADATIESAANNPFSEVFDSEELVLDQYSTFESLLLAEAPRVVNQTDTTFAQQLQALETTSLASVESDVLQSITVEAEDTNTQVLAGPEAITDPGDVLIIEDTQQPETSIVNGQKFRQLFSSLESAGSEPCFG